MVSSVQSAPEPPQLFGLKVQNISSSIGWGGQGGTCTLSLIDEGTPPDLPANGTAVGFNFQAFSFGGHLQRWTYKQSQSGRFYEIVLESPAKLLDGVQVILSDFETGYAVDGSKNYLTTQVKNVWNAFAHFESYAYGGEFGKAEVSPAGMPVTKLFEALAVFGAGDGTFGGKIVFGESEYTMDFSELESAVLERAPYYRVKGPVQNINGLLSDICETIQVDYFVQVDAPNNGVIEEPHLKVRICDRAEVESGIINSYINGLKDSGIIVSSSVGQELQDTATGKVKIGGAASRYYVAPVGGVGGAAYSVWQKFGNDAAWQIGGLVQTDYGSPFSSTLNIPLQRGGDYTATVFELRMALGGQQAWETFKVFQCIAGVEPNGYNLNSIPAIGNVEANTTILNLMTSGRADALDLAITSSRLSKAYSESLKQEAQNIYSSVNKVATEFFGQIFMVPLPVEPGGIGNNLRFIDPEGPAGRTNYEASWEISESAWNNDFPIGDWNFYDGGGRLQAVSAFVNSFNVDYSPLGSDYAVTSAGSVATTKGGPMKDIFWLGDEYNAVPHCIVKSGAQLRSYDGITTPDFGITVLANLFLGINIPASAYIAPGKQSVQVPIPPDVVVPLDIGIPQESTRYTWGPWFAWSDVANGKSEVEVDSNMKPETFGSVAAMDQVGFGSVFSGLARIEAVETGAVELAQAPAFNMGDKFAAAGPYVTSLDISIGTDGFKTSYKFSTWTPSFGKLAKYNADRISRVNKAGIALMKAERGRFNNVPFPKREFKPTQFGNSANGGQGFAGQGMELMNMMFKVI